MGWDPQSGEINTSILFHNRSYRFNGAVVTDYLTVLYLHSLFSFIVTPLYWKELSTPHTDVRISKDDSLDD